jgi:hypothetical protein
MFPVGGGRGDRSPALAGSPVKMTLSGLPYWSGPRAFVFSRLRPQTRAKADNFLLVPLRAPPVTAAASCVPIAPAAPAPGGALRGILFIIFPPDSRAGLRLSIFYHMEIWRSGKPPSVAGGFFAGFEVSPPGESFRWGWAVFYRESPVRLDPR